MDKAKAQKLIRLLTLIWVLAGLVLAGLTAGKIVSVDLFKMIFPVGFIFWIVVVTLLSKVEEGEEP